MSERFHVVTGGPGAGKSTLLERLAGAGFAVQPEAGRAVIRDQVAIGGRGVPWRDRELFAELMLGFDLRNHREAAACGGPVLFDRGVLDVVGYLRLEGCAVPAHVDAAARGFRYNRRVFAAPPWREIYERDRERRQDFAEAERTYDACVGAYRDYGYEVVELPRAAVGERARLVAAAVGAG
ncbi:AAA family ATPase [Sinosporangium siamense]|uniref:ATPase n=1 Tax=Sinosporangium siamense TaxID=1367973 RepID=A0A919RL12_9ACTN|nr:AAA family ATPase [Sinosporangium siamense]GII94031.1 ATPase [Sinosporangium siamense]